MYYPKWRGLSSTIVLISVVLPLHLAAQGAFVNLNFETGTFSGWTQGGGSWNSDSPPPNAANFLPGGQDYCSDCIINQIVGPCTLTDPRADDNLSLVYSGRKAAKINDENSDGSVSVITQTVTNYGSPHIYFAWAAVLQASHGARDSDSFTLQVRDDTTQQTIYQVAYSSYDASDSSLFIHTDSNWYYTPWQVQDLDVSKRQGHTFTITLLAADCPYGDHAGYAYLDSFGSVTPPSDESNAPLSVSGNQDLGTFSLGSTVIGSFSASGGTAPYTWAWVGNPPAGFSVSGGIVSGPASVPGNYSGSISVTDSVGSSLAMPFAWSVFGFASAALPDGVQFSLYLTSLGISGGTPPFNFTATGLPPGLSVTSSGTIQGTSPQAGTWSVSVRGTDSTGRSISGTFALRMIPPPPLSITSTSMPPGSVGSVYSQTASAVGGAPPYTWTLVAGTLSDGLTLRPGGTIAGIPVQAGNFSLTLRITDGIGTTATGQVVVPISSTPVTVKTPSPLATGVVGVEYPDQLISAEGGKSPYTFRISSGALPAGLTLAPNGSLTGVPTTAGSPTFTITATDAVGATGSATPSLTIQPSGTELMLSAGSLLFKLNAGATALPEAQLVAVQITKPGTPLPYSHTITPATTNWFTISSTGVAPGKLGVSLTPAALQLPAADTPYAATVQVQCTDSRYCSGTIQTLQVALRVSNVPPQLSVLSDLLAFSASPGNPRAITQNLGLQNIGGGSVGIGSIACAANWCSVTGIPGSLPSGPPVQLSVTADPAGLSTGYYRTTITMKTSVGTAVVPVTLFVSNSASMTLQPAGASFLSQVGGIPIGNTSSFLVDVAGADPVTWNASVLPGANWLTVNASSGTSTATSPTAVAYTIDPGVAASLTAGTYYGQIRVTAPNVTNSPLDYMVVLNVTPAGGIQRPNPVPGGLIFITAAGATIPAQTVTVGTNSAQPVLYTAASGADTPWLSVSPASGTALPRKPALSSVAVDTSKLSPGVYYGSVAYEFSGPVRYVNVTLIVVPPGQATSGLSLESRAVGCTPTQLVAAPTGILGNFAAPASWPTPIILRLFNDCGDTVSGGQIVASFSNGDPPLLLALADPKTATYAATWTPRKTTTQVTIRARASAPGLPVVISEISGAVSPNDVPVLDRNSTLNLFNPLKGAALAPGTLITLNGSALAGVPATAPAGTLPGILNGTKVLIGGLTAPVSAVSPSSVTVVTPVELEAGKQYQVIVSANGALTIPDNIQILNVAPGVELATAGFGAVRHADGTDVSKTAPAAPGETISLFAAGLGATDPPVAAGAVTPATPNQLVTPVTATVDAKPAAVKAAGLQTGAVAIYQVDVVIPSDAKDGDLAVELSQDGQIANTALVPVKKP